MYIPEPLRSCMVVEADVSTYLQTPSSGQVPIIPSFRPRVFSALWIFLVRLLGFCMIVQYCDNFIHFVDQFWLNISFRVWLKLFSFTFH
jgi:hypothetical protein